MGRYREMGEGGRKLLAKLKGRHSRTMLLDNHGLHRITVCRPLYKR